MSSRRASHAFVALVTALALQWESGAAAQRVVVKPARIEQQDGFVRLSVGFREMFDQRLRGLLRSGFAVTVVMRAYLYATKGGRPIAVKVRTLRALYDLWDEMYLLRVEDAKVQRHLRYRSQKMVVDRLTSFWRFPLTRVERLRRDKSYFVGALIEVNPMSPEALAEVRRWLRRPHRQRPGMAQESFFGSFVSIFVNEKIGRAEKIFKVRTQPFYRKP